MIPICHVQMSPDMNDAKQSMLEIFKHLDRDRYDVHVACPGPGPLTVELQRLGIAWHAIPLPGGVLNPMRSRRAYQSLCRLFQQQRFQLVHTHSSQASIVGRLAARRSGVRCVVHHVHGFTFHAYTAWPKRGLQGKLEQWGAAQCDRMIFVNHEERHLAVRRRWLSAARAMTVPYGVDLESIHPLRRERARTDLRGRWGLADKEVAILYAGRLEYPKQSHLLPKIAAALESLQPTIPWRLIVAGSGPDEPAVVRLIERLRIGHRLRMIGREEDSPDILPGADLALQASLAEGLSQFLIAAHAAGVPAVVSNATGNREVVNDDTGFLCDPKDPAGYARPLARLIDAPGLRAAMGRAARRRAEQLFDAATNNRRITSLYDELLSTASQAVAARRAA